MHTLLQSDLKPEVPHSNDDPHINDWLYGEELTATHEAKLLRHTLEVLALAIAFAQLCSMTP